MKQDTSYFTEMVTTKAGIITTTILTGMSFIFIDRSDESKMHGQFIGMLGGYSIVGLDNTVKLKIG